jgi:hypothetical protein
MQSADRLTGVRPSMNHEQIRAALNAAGSEKQSQLLETEMYADLAARAAPSPDAAAAVSNQAPDEVAATGETQASA